MKILNSQAVKEVYGFKDWLLGADIYIGRLPTSKRAIIEYDQKEFGLSWACTIYACLINFSHFTGYKFNLKERKEFVDRCYNKGLVEEGKGGYLHEVVEEFRQWIKYIGEYTYLRVEIGSDDYYKALDYGYQVITGFYGDSNFKKDRDDNCVVDTTTETTRSYGHCINQEENNITQDNYPDRKCNRYTINDDLLDTSYFNYGYIFTMTQDKQEIKKNMITRQALESCFRLNSNLHNQLSEGFINDDVELRELLKSVNDYMRDKYKFS